MRAFVFAERKYRRIHWLSEGRGSVGEKNLFHYKVLYVCVYILVVLGV
jgi:hypothetical protein